MVNTLFSPREALAIVSNKKTKFSCINLFSMKHKCWSSTEIAAHRAKKAPSSTKSTRQKGVA